MENRVTFINDGQLLQTDDAFVVRLSKDIRGKDALLNELKVKLRFPDYFGNNWDALLDMLCDFHWIQQNQIILIHDDLPALDEKNLNTYIQILIEASKSWQKEKQHSLEIVFPKNTAEKVKQYFREE